MVNDLAVQEFVEAIKEAPTDTNTTYNAVVSRIDSDGVVWINLQGSEKETPTASSSSEIKAGDRVTVNWRNNKLYIGGNYSNPSAGVTRVASVEASASTALATAETAQASAFEAGVLAGNAMASANGKNKIYRQSTQPTGGVYAVGDIWFDTANDNKINRWDGSAWVAFTLGDDALESISANKLTAGEIDASVITVSNLDAGNITSGNIDAARIQTNVVSAINATANKIDAKNINASQITVGSLQDGSLYSTTNDMNTAIGNAVDAVEVGGRNLLRSAPTREKTAEFHVYTIPTTVPFTDFKTGDKITIQLWDVVLDSASTGVRVFWGGGSILLVNTTSPDANGYISATYTVTGNESQTDAANQFIRIYNMPNAGHDNKRLTVGKWKLERGTRATDWTPSPEDVDADIAESAKTATTYISVIDDDGIKVHAQNNPTKNYTQIDADGMEVYSNSDSVASFGADGMRIGKTTEKHIGITSTSFNVYDEDGSAPVSVSTEGSLTTRTPENITIVGGTSSGISASRTTQIRVQGTITDSRLYFGTSTTGRPGSYTQCISNPSEEPQSITVDGITCTAQVVGEGLIRISYTNTTSSTKYVGCKWTEQYYETYVKVNNVTFNYEGDYVPITDTTGVSVPTSSSVSIYGRTAMLTLSVYNTASVSIGGLIYSGQMLNYLPVRATNLVGYYGSTANPVMGLLNPDGSVYVHNVGRTSVSSSASQNIGLHATYILR